MSLNKNEKVTRLFVRCKCPNGDIEYYNIWNSDNSHGYTDKKRWEFIISQGYWYVPKTGRTSHYAGKYNCKLTFCVWDSYQKRWTETFERILGWSDEPRIEYFAKFFGKVVLEMNNV